MDYERGKWMDYFDELKDEEGSVGRNEMIRGCLDMEGVVWVGRDGEGLVRYDGKKDVLVGEGLGEEIGVIYKILGDKDKLWFSRNNGMYCYEGVSCCLKFYNKKDGLEENLFVGN